VREACVATISLQLTCLRRLEGGRQHPILPDDRAVVFWSDRADAGNDAILTCIDGPNVAPGEAAIAQLQFIHPELVAERLRVGATLYLGGGRRIVAPGVILLA
jgi:hypothetical protein